MLDVGATIVVAHSEKEHAAPTYKRTFGYHPIGVWCDNTTECLAASQQPGNAGSNTAADHIDVLAQAIAQIPTGHRRGLLIRSDGARRITRPGRLDHRTDRVRGRRVEYSVGFSVTAPMRRAIATCPEAAWGPAFSIEPSKKMQPAITHRGLIGSMGRVGAGGDNGAMEMLLLAPAEQRPRPTLLGRQDEPRAAIVGPSGFRVR